MKSREASPSNYCSNDFIQLHIYTGHRPTVFILDCKELDMFSLGHLRLRDTGRIFAEKNLGQMS